MALMSLQKWVDLIGRNGWRDVRRCVLRFTGVAGGFLSYAAALAACQMSPAIKRISFLLTCRQKKGRV